MEADHLAVGFLNETSIAIEAVVGSDIFKG